MHNSNRQLRQVTFSGEVLLEYKFYVIGFVPADVVRLRKDVWFSKLNSEQVDSVDQFLAGSGYSQSMCEKYRHLMIKCTNPRTISNGNVSRNPHFLYGS